MDFIFIRHGQGEHTLNLPDSLQIQDPALTKKGIKQAESLQSQITITDKDIVVISPIRRTLETANILTRNIGCRKVVSPLVSPRMFPQNPEWETLPCDRMLDKKLIREEFPSFTIYEGLPEEFWISGINTMPEQEFSAVAARFLEWCREQNAERIYVVSHDGTINSYRQFIRGENLTREDFLKDAGWITQSC
ncbi:histidine phosphatase family protein [Bacillus salacetis]|uniref:histidine phosphatase family protein n=1 Tax=Bacillus salacetis TaxID=2315464 RepID=UPI003BA21B66